MSLFNTRRPLAIRLRRKVVLKNVYQRHKNWHWLARGRFPGLVYTDRVWFLENNMPVHIYPEDQRASLRACPMLSYQDNGRRIYTP